MRGVLAGLLIAAMLAASPLPVAASQLSNYQAKEAQVNSQLQYAQNEYSRAQTQYSVAHQELITVENQIATVNAEIQKLQGEIAADNTRSDQLQTQITSTKQKVSQDQQRSNSGLVLLQQHGTTSFLAVLLGATSFTDFLTRLEFLTRIWASEMSLLRQTQAAQAQLQRQEASLTATLHQLQGTQAQLDAKRNALQTQESDASAAKQREAQAEAQAASAINSLTQQKNGIIAAINTLLAEIRSGKISWSQVMAIIDQLAQRYGIDPRLVEAVVIAESGGNSTAKSSVGAEGLMQLMPGTAAGLGVTNPYDPVQNVQGGITYLLEMLQLFKGNLQLAIAAYNAGPGAVEKYGGIPPYAETQNYVHEVLGLYQEGK